ncbi:MAG: SDR family NAD(P)-dependent oxidoreductase, partial [Silicimonas sp.]|nr:SDR family NAD(P)-dependent oxidoreductase [Silicimonas sp.]
MRGTDDLRIAVVGMAVRLPGAGDTETFWRNLRDGTCSIRKFSREELESSNVPGRISNQPNFVPYGATLDQFDYFDAEFFGLSPKEAAVMDPQHRQFLELSWEALERAGHTPDTFDGKIGVYAGSGMGSYFYFNVCSNSDLVDGTGMFLLRHTGNDKDFLSTRVSHTLDLRGPSINLQTACSTSLVAVHYAAQSLLNGDCDMALAGGVTIELPQGQGYLYKENEVLSPDGQCRAFDHRAQGTVFGSGAGIVVLRRLEDAIRDGDPIWAVVKGSAVNNDGAQKAGYLAPSVEGQAEAIAASHKSAGVPASTIDYIECHGTGTYLGDPIEVAALNEAFDGGSLPRESCRIGSVKTNIGHLDTAAGVASLVKASLALHHKEMPATLGFEAPNPAIDFENSPFVVNDALTPWKRGDHPRRAGVNSLGVGGTNAHVVLEESPEVEASEESAWPFQLLTLSARSKTALDDAANNLADHLDAHSETQRLADIAYTLKEGRRGFDQRRVVVADTHDEAAKLLRENDPRRVFTHTKVADNPDVVFMFPGGGAQYAGMARDLYETEPVFAEWMDRGLEHLAPKLDYDIRALWLPKQADLAAADETLKTPSIQLPLIMIVEYALAQLWMSWGVKPSALIGHSMGENTAACLAGVMSFEDCIGLVHLRGKLFDSVPGGGMLSVNLPEDALRARIGTDLDIASINATDLTVVSGTVAALEALQAELEADEIDCQRIAINIAAHSRALEPILEEFRAYLASIELHAPEIPFVSNRTGTWITKDEATDPDYWVGHLRNTVRFADGIETLSENAERIYIEVGPGRAMASLAGQHPRLNRNQVLGTLRDPGMDVADDKFFIAMLGRAWATGADFDWTQIWEGARRKRVLLPTYPFQKSRYFIEKATATGADTPDWLMRSEDRETWTYQPQWKPVYADCAIDVTGDLSDAEPETWLIFQDDTGLGKSAAAKLRAAGHQVITAEPGDTFARLDDRYILAPEMGAASYEALLQDLSARDMMPTRIAHLWMVTRNEHARPGSSFYHRLQEQGFWSLFYLAQAWASVDGEDVHLSVFTSDAARVRDEVLRYPDKATVMGPARVIPREFPGITCSVLDIQGGTKDKTILAPVLEELLATPGNTVAALRGERRYEQIWCQRPLPKTENPISVDAGDVVLLTGGLGGIGLMLTEELLKKGARVALLSRQEIPDRSQWDRLLDNLAPNDKMARRLSALKKLDALEGDVMTIAADISNVEDMRKAIDLIDQNWGNVTGIIHAAGVIDDAPILSKSPGSISDVLTPKVQGTQVLDTLFPDGTLKWMALFSSSSTVTAPAGQVDYVAANEYLNALAKARIGGKTKVIAIDWGIWSEIGMAAQAMDSRTGVVLDAPRPVKEPMLDAATFNDQGDRRFISKWRTKEQWVLHEHRTRAGDALLPGTGYLELAAQAMEAQGEVGSFEIRDLNFLRPLRVEDFSVTSVRMTLPRDTSGYQMSVESSTSKDDAGFETNAEAELRLLPMVPPAPIDLQAVASRCHRLVHAEEGKTLKSPQDAHLLFGPRWDVLKSMRFGDGEGLARLTRPAGDPEYFLHPGLMDIATGWAVELIDSYDPSQFWVPMSYRSVRIFGPLPSDLTSWVRITSEDNNETARFDITLCAPDGVVCVDIKGFTIRRLSEETRFAAASGQSSGATGPRPLSPAEERLRHNISQGILPKDGAALFFRALEAGKPQILISSLELDGLVSQFEHDADPKKLAGQTFERPDLESEYVAPEGEIEIKLAGFWTELLGVDKIGADDNFFDLGGHSLIAVRLFTMVKSAFAVDFPISILFEAPTIRKCAALIEAKGGKASSDTTEPGETHPSDEKRFTHLVPMHQGEGGDKTPFFMVAGMFGNVLNLRHLAHLLGADRPFYGLQARGLYGGDEPHNDLVDAARDYIVEMKKVQPKGPYLVGGFSGGGITAYEIARQLREEGEIVASLIMLDTPLPRRRGLTKTDRIK